MNFAKWMDNLDEACQSESEMLIHDLPQSSLHNAYSSGFSPEQFRFTHLAAAQASAALLNHSTAASQ